MTGNVIVIIGASGAMGRWFLRYFASRGWTVIGTTRDAAKARALQAEMDERTFTGQVQVTMDLAGSIPKASMVMISVPIPSHGDTIATVAPLMQKDAILLDIASVKGSIPALLDAARKAHGIHVLSIHPMFGPGAESMRRKNVILIDIEGDKQVLNRFKEIIMSDEPVIVETTAEAHDRMIARTLGVPHFLNIVFGSLLKEEHAPLQEIANFGGTTFHLQHLIAQEVSLQDPLIYATIQMENPSFIAMIDGIVEQVTDLARIVKEKDYTTFMTRFKEIHVFFSHLPGFESVMTRFNEAAARSLELLHGERGDKANKA